MQRVDSDLILFEALRHTSRLLVVRLLEANLDLRSRGGRLGLKKESRLLSFALEKVAIIDRSVQLVLISFRLFIQKQWLFGGDDLAALLLEHSAQFFLIYQLLFGVLHQRGRGRSIEFRVDGLWLLVDNLDWYLTLTEVRSGIACVLLLPFLLGFLPLVGFLDLHLNLEEVLLLFVEGLLRGVMVPYLVRSMTSRV